MIGDFAESHNQVFWLVRVIFMFILYCDMVLEGEKLCVNDTDITSVYALISTNVTYQCKELLLNHSSNCETHCAAISSTTTLYAGCVLSQICVKATADGSANSSFDENVKPDFDTYSLFPQCHKRRQSLQRVFCTELSKRQLVKIYCLICHPRQGSSMQSTRAPRGSRRRLLNETRAIQRCRR